MASSTTPACKSVTPSGRPRGTGVYLVEPQKVSARWRHRGHAARLKPEEHLDITALGRQQQWENSPEGYPQTPPYKWWNWHDNYEAGAAPDPK